MLTCVIPMKGDYPTAPLTDAEAAGWTVEVRVHLIAPITGAKGTVTVAVDESVNTARNARKQQGTGFAAAAAAIAKETVAASLVSGNNTVTVTLTVPPQTVSLWWPNEMGAQSLYNITASWTPDSDSDSNIGDGDGGEGTGIITISRRVGFRFVALVTGDDADPSTLAGGDGTGNYTMRLNVNGAKLWSRGVSNNERPTPPPLNFLFYIQTYIFQLYYCYFWR